MLNIKADYRNSNNNITLFNNDCLQVLEVIPNNSIDLVVTDPPYRVIAHGGGNNPNIKYCGGILNHNNKDVRQGKLFQYNDIRFSQWLPLVYNKLKNNTHCYIFINRSQSCRITNRSRKSWF